MTNDNSLIKRNLLLCGLLPLAFLTLLVASSPVSAITFSSDTLINAGDYAYDAMDIVVDGCILTVNGEHTFNSLLITSGGHLTHSDGADGFDLTVTGDLTVDSGGYIDVSNKGYTGGSGSGSGGTGVRGGGGSYGGYGGSSASATGGQTVYGSIIAPSDFGSGGGIENDQSYIGGSGGGLIRLTVGGSLSVEGSNEICHLNSSGDMSNAHQKMHIIS